MYKEVVFPRITKVNRTLNTMDSDLATGTATTSVSIDKVIIEFTVIK